MVAMAKSVKAVLLSFSMVFLAAVSAFAAKTMIVAADGSGDFKTFEEAVKAAQKGDTVIIRGPSSAADGIWHIGSISGQTLTVRGEGPVEIDRGTAAGIPVYNSVTLDNITIDGPVEIAGEGVSLLNCWARIREHKPSDREESIIAIVKAKKVTIKGCRITGPVSRAITVADSKDVRIEHNLITGAWHEAIYIGMSGKVKGTSKVDILSNTIVYNCLPEQYQADVKMATGIGIWVDKPKAVIRDNIIAFNQSGILFTRLLQHAYIPGVGSMSVWQKPGQILEVKNNLIFEHSMVDYGEYRTDWSQRNKEKGLTKMVDQSKTKKPAKSENLSFDPAFVSPQSGDFRFKPDSPALVASSSRGPLGAAAGMREDLLMAPPATPGQAQPPKPHE